MTLTTSDEKPRLGIGIDTQLFVYAYKIRKNISESEKQKYDISSMLLLESISNNTLIHLSMHQIAEIYHTLAFRRPKMPLHEAKNKINAIMNSNAFKIHPVTIKDLSNSLDQSKESKIHVWDFLCFIPIEPYISKFYSVDSHFRHKKFEKHNIDIINPLEKWEII
ncbi:MAG: hypothetical protein ACTSYA_09660 [Candidatus Kariarchaeaceae archaeon]